MTGGGVPGHRLPAPYFSLARAAWVPCVVLWDEQTDELRCVEGPEGVHEYRHAVEVRRFLASGRGGTRHDE